MKIILLSGDKHCGKTTTLTMVYDTLTKGMNQKPNVNCIKPKKDFHCSFTYKKKNKEVAIVTFGDVLYLFIEMIIFYCTVDYLIIAFSKGGIIKSKVLNFFRKCKQHTCFDKTVSKIGTTKAIKDKANLIDCNKIINAIK